MHVTTNDGTPEKRRIFDELNKAGRVEAFSIVDGSIFLAELVPSIVWGSLSVGITPHGRQSFSSPLQSD